jgi:hypothetical protein
MTDLRTRIAYAIAQADGDEPGMEPASCDYEMADAVIAELGLIRDPFSTVAFCRYVTQWEPNEQFRPNVETP